MMIMKRPGIVWLFTLYLVGGIVSTTISRISALVDPSIISNLSQIEYYSVMFSPVLIIVQAIFAYLFFMLKKNSLIWLYIMLGLTIIISLISMKWMYAGIAAILMWVIWDYISHKKIDGQPLFT